jgi:hypothetical protein
MGEVDSKLEAMVQELKREAGEEKSRLHQQYVHELGTKAACRDDRCADAVGRGVKPEDIDSITCKSCEELATSLIKCPSCQGVVACSHCKKENFSRNYGTAHKCQICARKVCDDCATNSPDCCAGYCGDSDDEHIGCVRAGHPAGPWCDECVDEHVCKWAY